jgi:hypothetical protein
LRQKRCFPWHAGAGEAIRPSAAKAGFIAKYLRTA